MMKDPYVYEGTDVLINRLNIRDPELLKSTEADYTVLNLKELYDDFNIKSGFDQLCAMHKKIFDDVYEWAGQPRTIDIEKPEDVLNGLSIEYSKNHDIEADAIKVFNQIDKTDWKEMNLSERAETFSDYLSDIWRVHPFREGNTRTCVTYFLRLSESQGMYHNPELFSENAEYVRAALVASNAYWPDGFDKSDKRYLYNIVKDSMSQGTEMKKRLVASIERSGFRPNENIIRNMVSLNRRSQKEFSIKEIYDMYKKQDTLKENDFINVSEIAKECKEQEIKRSQTKGKNIDLEPDR